MTSENGIPVSWNADGNMISDGVNTYSWTYGNRMMGASRSGMTATYDYDSDDRRTKKTVNGVVTRVMWSGADEVGEYNAAGTLIRRFVPDGTGGMDARLMTVEAGGTAYWHHTDRQGSVVATSSAAGQVVSTATYSPHGEFGTGVTAPPTGSPFGYTGRQYDPETGLYQYRARYYSPRLGVFLSTDPIGTKDDPNLYLYVGADPVNHTDPTGLCMGSRIGTASGPICRGSGSSNSGGPSQGPETSRTRCNSSSTVCVTVADNNSPSGGAAVSSNQVNAQNIRHRDAVGSSATDQAASDIAGILDQATGNEIVYRMDVYSVIDVDVVVTRKVPTLRSSPIFASVSPSVLNGADAVFHTEPTTSNTGTPGYGDWIIPDSRGSPNYQAYGTRVTVIEQMNGAVSLRPVNHRDTYMYQQRANHFQRRLTKDPSE